MGMAMRVERNVHVLRQPIGVQRLLEWAFGAECASVEFREFAAPAGRDTISVLMERGLLGCKVDGGRQGGGAQSASDAEIVAGVVAALPVEHGGRGMAVKVAEYARAGMVPDWMPDARPRVVPMEWRRCKHGLYAVTEDARDMRFAGHGRFQVRDSRACPVRVLNTAQQIGAARRFYLEWVGALMHLRYALSVAGLSRWDVTDDLPEMTPWLLSEKSA